MQICRFIGLAEIRTRLIKNVDKIPPWPFYRCALKVELLYMKRSYNILRSVYYVPNLVNND